MREGNDFMLLCHNEVLFKWCGRRCVNVHSCLPIKVPLPAWTRERSVTWGGFGQHQSSGMSEAAFKSLCPHTAAVTPSHGSLWARIYGIVNLGGCTEGPPVLLLDNLGDDGSLAHQGSSPRHCGFVAPPPPYTSHSPNLSSFYSTRPDFPSLFHPFSPSLFPSSMLFDACPPPFIDGTELIKKFSRRGSLTPCLTLRQKTKW